jgi:hypothetical protein
VRATLGTIAISISLAALGPACSLLGSSNQAVSYGEEVPEPSDEDIDGAYDDGTYDPDETGDDAPDGSYELCGGEPDLPYDIKIQCGDSVIPVLAAFREKNGANVRFAPAPGTTADCPFVVEGAQLRAGEIGSCAAFTATEADATTEGNKDEGRDRVDVTWCWYTGAAADGEDCCLPEGAGGDIECETDHLDIRFYCDGGEGVPAGADEPLGSSASTAECTGGGSAAGDGAGGEAGGDGAGGTE